MWGDEVVHERRSNQCQIMTSGALPWGVCYEPTGSLLDPMGTTITHAYSGRVVPSFFLNKCTLGNVIPNKEKLELADH